MRVAFFPTLAEAQKCEAACYAAALADGQKCEKWADIIEDKKLGFGVPVKDRVLKALGEAKVADYTVEAVSVLTLR